MSTMQGETMPLGPGAAGDLFKGLMSFKASDSAGITAERSQARPPAAARSGAEADSGHPAQAATAGPRARPRIVFVVMSAVAKPETVDQLAHALAPHLVLVHHDFSQTPVFELTASNVQFVPQPMRTGWAQFGFVEGIFHALQYAVNHLDFDYLQLLSPTCLPIRPLQEFERHVSALEDAHFDCLDLLADKDALMCVGYRAWTDAGTPMHRLMRRLTNIYFDGSPGRRDEAGVWIRTGAGLSLWSQLAGVALRALPHPLIGRHLREQPLRLYYGSTWFGARRHIVAGMVRNWQQPGVRPYFKGVRIAEEFLVPSLLMKMRPHKGRMNHLVQRFNEAHPGYFGVEHMEQLRQSGAYFARKFPDDPAAPVRLQVLSELVQQPAAANAASAAA